MSAILPPSVLNSLDAATKTAVGSVPGADMPMILNGNLLGMMGGQLLAMPGLPPKPQVKAAILALLMDKSMLGAAIDAKIADAVKALPSSSGLTADAVDKKIADAVKGLPTTANIGKMHLVSGGGRRRGSRRGSKRAKRRGTKRR